MLKEIMRYTNKVINDFEVENIILKPHPSTPDFYKEMTKDSLSQCIDWNEFKIMMEKKYSNFQIIEAASMPFRYAIFQCFHQH